MPFNILCHNKNGVRAQLHFTFEKNIKRKFTPLYPNTIHCTRPPPTPRQLPNYVPRGCIEIFQGTSANNTADFCLEMYRRLNLLDGLRVVRSSNPSLRCAACDITEFFVDVPHEGEIVRARCNDGALR